MAEVTKTVEKVKEPTLQERIADKIKSRKATPVLLDGKAGRFDIKRYGGHDYTVGGQLQPRLVNNNETRIRELMAQGYDFPPNWDSTLPDLEVSGLRLMLRSTENSKKAREWHAEHARELDRSKAPGDTANGLPKEATHGAKFESSPVTQENVTLSAGTKARSVGPE